MADQVTGGTEKATMILPEIATMGGKRMEELVKLQTDLMSQIREINQQWLDRLQSEVALTSEVSTKLMAAPSIPEAVTVWREFGTRRFEMMTEDVKHLISDNQKLMASAGHLLSNSWPSNGARIGT